MHGCRVVVQSHCSRSMLRSYLVLQALHLWHPASGTRAGKLLLQCSHLGLQLHVLLLQSLYLTTLLFELMLQISLQAAA